MASARLVTVGLLAAFFLEIIRGRPVNAAAIAIAKSAEGCVLRACRDLVGALTIGYGHTGPDVRASTVIIQLQADIWCSTDTARAGSFVDEYVYLR